ncbi:NHLP leader peptide family RiPP precursor [Desulfovibrio inopinatus]|uniref:NHLP leader peptide family RiPP precursor n=1 Tax=Desulfovibrio inopinatus TaxID=102109 RepID=UPI00041E2A66|nr:NHLP leader peptide family RiPP precursor [Desulfovibrio inopinatus]
MSQEGRNQITQQIIAKVQEDASFKKALLSNPQTALQETFGIAVPEKISITVLEETPEQLYLVLPVDPSDLELSDEALKNLAAASSSSNVWQCGN